MKRCLYVLPMVVLAWIFIGCKDSKPSATDTLVVEETECVDMQPTPDDEDAVDELIAETPMPVAAEELFDDFFFNFASNKRLQLERIDFPLLVNSGTKKDTLRREDWQMEHFFMHQEEYTLIFDDEQQEELGKSTGVSDVTVEKIFLDDAFIRQYLFSKNSGRWMLVEIRNQTLPKNPNASFLEFYQHFVTDSVFQRESLNSEIHFVGPDPDDEFSAMEGVITPDFWDAFAPAFPSHLIYNVVYSHQDPEASRKIFVIRGISNGQEIGVTFERKGNGWRLIKLTE